MGAVVLKKKNEEESFVLTAARSLGRSKDYFKVYLLLPAELNHVDEKDAGQLYSLTYYSRSLQQ